MNILSKLLDRQISQIAQLKSIYEKTMTSQIIINQNNNYNIIIQLSKQQPPQIYQNKLTYTFHIDNYKLQTVTIKMHNLQEYLYQDYQFFQSPIQGIQFSIKKPSNESPNEINFQFYQSGSFKKIIQKQNQSQSENEHEIQIQTINKNHICQFKTFDQNPDDILPIIQNKQNQVPSSTHLQTPLKNKQLRSPLKDITPSITKRKKKSALKTINQKYTYMTPRTMAESRFSSGSGLRKIQRL